MESGWLAGTKHGAGQESGGYHGLVWEQVVLVVEEGWEVASIVQVVQNV